MSLILYGDLQRVILPPAGQLVKPHTDAVSTALLSLHKDILISSLPALFNEYVVFAAK